MGPRFATRCTNALKWPTPATVRRANAWWKGDASAATYFLAAGAIAGRGVRVHGVGAASIQGDAAFADVLEAMGAQVERRTASIAAQPGPLTGIDADLNYIPDAAMTVAVLALFAKGTTRIGNIANWRVKETDRLAAMAQELRKLGADVQEGPDHLTIEPPPAFKPATIETYGDHRMAMCFSLAALGGVPVTIKNPGCVAKTFPDYFDRFTDFDRRLSGRTLSNRGQDALAPGESLRMNVGARASRPRTGRKRQ